MSTTTDQEPIRYFDYRPRYLDLKEEIDDAIQRVLASGMLILGPEVEAFESELAAYLDAPHAVTVASGTDAIELALRALGIGPGHEVITVSHTAVASVAAIRATGATPVLVDVLPDTMLVDPDAIEKACGPKTKAAVVVHLYGNPARLDAIQAVAKRKDIALIEDCAQAFGSRWSNRYVGTLGDIGCFSFYPTKNLGALGDGGAIVTRHASVAERLRKLRMYGFADKDGHSHIEGFNSRLDELQAAILRVKLRHVDYDLRERRRLAELYERRLAGSSLVLPVTTNGGAHSYHLYVVRSPDRDSAIRQLDEAGIGYGIHYPIPVHSMDAYTATLEPVTLPETERACREVLSLPLYPGLRDDQLNRVCDVLADS